MNKLLKLSTIILSSFLLLGCKSPSLDSSLSIVQVEKSSFENTFWNSLEQQCGSIYKGKSSFPDSPEDSFYGKTLVANFSSCTLTEIRVPFEVGENKSRTWIFTKLPNGKIQLKHQHLHDDGRVDEVSNYGGVSSLGQIDQNTKTMHLHFPADEFTKQLIPAASSNIWTIEMSSNLENGKSSLGYYLFRHDKKRFIANLYKTD